MKDEAVERLFEALDAALGGHIWVSAAMRERLLPEVLASRARGVPTEDAETRTLLAELRRGNRTVLGISRALSRPHAEVERQLESVRHRLQLPSRASLFLYADTLPPA
jgi:hypothetical protein